MFVPTVHGRSTASGRRPYPAPVRTPDDDALVIRTPTEAEMAEALGMLSEAPPAIRAALESLLAGGDPVGALLDADRPRAVGDAPFRWPSGRTLGLGDLLAWIRTARSTSQPTTATDR